MSGDVGSMILAGSAPKKPLPDQRFDLRRQFPEPEHPTRRDRRFSSSDVVEYEPISPVGEVAEIRLMRRQLPTSRAGANVPQGRRPAREQRFQFHHGDDRAARQIVGGGVRARGE